MDEEWPKRAQEVILTLRDMVAQFTEKADSNMVDDGRACNEELVERKN